MIKKFFWITIPLFMYSMHVNASKAVANEETFTCPTSLNCQGNSINSCLTIDGTDGWGWTSNETYMSGPDSFPKGIYKFHDVVAPYHSAGSVVCHYQQPGYDDIISFTKEIANLELYWDKTTQWTFTDNGGKCFADDNKKCPLTKRAALIIRNDNIAQDIKAVVNGIEITNIPHHTYGYVLYEDTAKACEYNNICKIDLFSQGTQLGSVDVDMDNKMKFLSRSLLSRQVIIEQMQDKWTYHPDEFNAVNVSSLAPFYCPAAIKCSQEKNSDECRYDANENTAYWGLIKNKLSTNASYLQSGEYKFRSVEAPYNAGGPVICHYQLQNNLGVTLSFTDIATNSQVFYDPTSKWNLTQTTGQCVADDPKQCPLTSRAALIIHNDNVTAGIEIKDMSNTVRYKIPAGEYGYILYEDALKYCLYQNYCEFRVVSEERMYQPPTAILEFYVNDNLNIFKIVSPDQWKVTQKQEQYGVDSIRKFNVIDIVDRNNPKTKH